MELCSLVLCHTHDLPAFQLGRRVLWKTKAEVKSVKAASTLRSSCMMLQVASKNAFNSRTLKEMIEAHSRFVCLKIEENFILMIQPDSCVPPGERVAPT